MAALPIDEDFESVDRSYLPQETASRKLNHFVGLAFLLTLGVVSTAALYSFSKTRLLNVSSIKAGELIKVHHDKEVGFGDADTLPNFVFVLADDMGWNSMGYEDYDLTFASPYLTAMSQNGIVMSNYYAQEVCTPSRAALLTGRYPLTIGMQVIRI